MTLTLELPNEAMADLAAHAARLGVPVEDYASTVLQEAIEDAADAADAARILAETKPEEWIPWEQVKAAAKAEAGSC